MSRISDDSDSQRIAEMQEMELRNRKDLEKRQADTRITKAFSEVMKSKETTEQGQQAAKGAFKRSLDQKQAQQGSVLNRLVKDGQRGSGELARRAALSKALSSNLSKVAAQGQEESSQALTSRSRDLVQQRDDERSRVGKEVREREDDEVARAEEGQVEQKRLTAETDLKNAEAYARTDENGSRRQQQGRQRQEQEERRAEAVQATEAPRAAHVPRISQELIDRIVSSISAAHQADGRTELQVDLKGTLLDGVRLKVRAENGKVSCHFEGCDPQLKNLLESSKGMLMRALSRQKMTLSNMTVS